MMDIREERAQTPIAPPSIRRREGRLGAPSLYSRASSRVITAGQDLGRYVVREGGWEEVDRFWIASVGEAAGLDELDVWRIFGGRAGPLAKAQPSGVWSLCCDWWSFGVGSTCGYGLIGRDRRANASMGARWRCEERRGFGVVCC